MVKVFMTCECITYRKEVTCKDTKDDNNEGTEKVPFFVRFYTLIVGNMV